ncbi:hypothetical protein FE257_006491 [Aspergillus nanangensis]|uniref:Xylanolytic transcriptional activator regulatory domain-containing protein n=1 Tax=Aspergillus nanangensis TaxID=2582783 RepID=A0AAD4CZC7_ASPNN|nr:hypothetical protein FE257_006491 [Aspergillus nanangensis]
MHCLSTQEIKGNIFRKFPPGVTEISQAVRHVPPFIILLAFMTRTQIIAEKESILNYEEEDAFELVRQIRSCDSLEEVAQSIIGEGKVSSSAADETAPTLDESLVQTDQFESELAGKMSELVLDGSRKFIGGTSNLIFLPPGSELNEFKSTEEHLDVGLTNDRSITAWTRVTDNEQLISHLMTMYFTWHYPFFTTLSKDLFYRDYINGRSSQYCSSLLVNAMLALGCHFSSWEGAREDPRNASTAGDHFFKEARRLILENDEDSNAKLCTVQALALMSVREAGCGREGKGWVYSGMSFRMALDLGLNVDSTSLATRNLDEEEVDARRITFWGCFLFDKCWSNYLGRQPQLPTSNVSIPKIDMIPSEEAEMWSPYTDIGVSRENTQASRTRAIALQISKLCEISGDLIMFFYDPTPRDKPLSKQTELKKLSEIHTRLEAWKKDLPKELEAKEGQLPPALLMHMLYQLLFIHLYRPFLKYTRTNTPLPQHVSPRKLCTQAASTISKYLRIYKRTYGFKQVCNIVVYVAHTACTIHLLNLPDKNAQRDVIHCLRHLDEMGDSWLCARRTIRILEISASKWQIELPSEAVGVFEQTHAKWGSWGSWDLSASPSASNESVSPTPGQHHTMARSNLAPPARGAPTREHITSLETPGLDRPSVSQYSNSMSIPAPLPSMGPSQQPRSTQLVQTDGLPEPTYLRPATQNYSSMQAVPMTQYDSWYSPNERSARLGTGRTVTPSTNSSPMTGFHTPENLVEESQDWWARDPNAFQMGMGPWGPGWDTGISGTTYDNSIPGGIMSQTSGTATTGPPQPMRPPPGVNRMTQPGQGADLSAYDGPMAFPENFQQQ